MMNICITLLIKMEHIKIIGMYISLISSHTILSNYNTITIKGGWPASLFICKSEYFNFP